MKLTTTPLDQYAATTAYNQSYAYPDVILEYTGWHTVSFKVTSKNASSSGYKMFLSFIALTSAEPAMP